ncbi:transposase [Streptomyces sp. SHP 1-2]|uniref:transposase n=1 Tax=Streptomyces sp. SHP 1-2 TaxID=2769489 RepID=UPI002240E557|nr:transposase [Streptomyces sp. SHP 1-2]MCW5253618.1 transposase [Streptomyces sp. SHP 1-2]
MGRSRGGLTTKIHLAADGRCRPPAFVLTAGQAGDAPAFTDVMARLRVPRRRGRPRIGPDLVLADKVYSSRAIREHQESTGGDIAGWGGDIMTFWANWRDAVDEYASPLAFCEAKLAVPGTVSSFGYTDMIEDVDGYLLAKHDAGGGNVVDWMKAHTTTGALSPASAATSTSAGRTPPTRARAAGTFSPVPPT